MNYKTIFNILAMLSALLGLTMLIPAGISWYYQEGVTSGFLFSSVFCILAGLPLWILYRNDRRLTNKDGFAIVAFSWITTAAVSAIPFYLTGAIPNITDAFFESMSGVTTTGATILGSPVTMPHLPNGIESLPMAVLFWRSFLQWIGGMGIIVFYIAILPLLGVGGVQLFRAEMPGPVADKIRPRVKETARFLWMTYLGLTFAEIILLSMSGLSWFDSVCHAFTTMPTGGFSTKNASIGAFANPVTHYIIIIFMILAGVNFTLHFRALTGNVKAYFRDKEFLFYIGIIFGVTFIIFLSLGAPRNEWSHDNFRNALFQTVSILTSSGYSTTDYELWTFFAQFLLLNLMFIGGMGGSTGGGMKIVRFMLILKYAASETRRMLHAKAIIPIRIGDRFISEDIIRNTLGFFLFYVSIFAITSITLTAMDLDILSAVSVAAASIGNTGPALGAFGPTDSYALLHPIGKWLLTFCMLLGRLEIFTIMVIFSRTFWK